MRLHTLTLSAFGPFAGTERVDFDELNDAGLFLLTGPTGAGKSSLLDAVCFALYGTVPGARGTKSLKSQHAPADARPEVVLDFSVRGRRFVVRRTPEWTRPKRRGSGLLTEKASASILEVTTGTEHFLTSRAAEVGLLVGDLMGMSAGQFVQVALLPQGEFQTFLRASSQDRHDVLQQLFRTDRFARIEVWVGEHSRRLRDRAADGHATVRRILDTVTERSGRTVPEPLDGDQLATAAADGRLRSWVSEVLAASEADADLARAERHRTRRELLAARRRHEDATRRRELQERRNAALDVLATLEQSEPDAAEVRERLSAHDRASRCGPVLALHREAVLAEAAAHDARDRAVRLLTAAPPPALSEVALPPVLSAEAVSELAERTRRRVARLEAVLPRERTAADALRRRDDDAVRLRAAQEDLDDATARAAQVPREIETATHTLAVSAALAAQHEGLTDALDAAGARLDAASELDRLRPRLAALADARRDARDRMQDERERLQTLVARRLAGMAAELAGALVDGGPCQVCGSTTHPRPATPAADAVTVADQRLAEHRVAAATAALEVVERDLADQQRRHDLLGAASCGLTPRAAADRVTEVAAALAGSRAARAEHAVLEDRLRHLREEQETSSRRRAEAAAAVAGLHASVGAHEQTLRRVTAEISDAVGAPTSGTTLTEGVAELRDWCDLLVEAGRCLADLVAARARLATVGAQAHAAAEEHGFTGADPLGDVAGAVLPDDVRDRLRERLGARSEARAAARAVLDAPEVAALGAPDRTVDGQGAVGSGGSGADAGDAPSVRCADALTAAESADDVAARALAVHEDRVASLRLLLDRLDRAVDAWAPVRDEALRAEAISKLVRGMGQDNQLQMRLSAYVLAARLDQVLAAANERLGHMRDQRYLLRRTGRADRRGSQAGLGLEILDQWTGDVRAPSTLSGGETFVVSLSLALGLADVVTHESGGTEVETLFVDEGFGMLDADTLDDVMDRLDGLRAGGRTVGVVSHVTELRSRIPTQVQVQKGRTGSTVRISTLVG